MILSENSTVICNQSSEELHINKRGVTSNGGIKIPQFIGRSLENEQNVYLNEINVLRNTVFQLIERV